MIPFLRDSFRNQRPRESQRNETENYCCCLPWQWLHQSLNCPESSMDSWKSSFLLIYNIVVVVCLGSDYFCRESFLISQQFSVSFPPGVLSASDRNQPQIVQQKNTFQENITRIANAVQVTLWLSLILRVVIRVSQFVRNSQLCHWGK